jgi:hypothetical protein
MLQNGMPEGAKEVYEALREALNDHWQEGRASKQAKAKCPKGLNLDRR